MTKSKSESGVDQEKSTARTEAPASGQIAPGLGYKASPARILLPSQYERWVFALFWLPSMLSLVAAAVYAVWSIAK